MSYKGLFLAAALALLSACDSSTPETPAAPSGKPAAQQEAARPALDKAEREGTSREEGLREALTKAVSHSAVVGR